ncbi:MAG: hypothetical protein FWG31_04520 [Oscillospiraceae bacterium]|nr:hypothetical protein [Oscillospiraceae bacterium]
MQTQEPKKKRPPDEDEETDLTLDLPAFLPLDTAGNIFDRDAAKRFGGINTDPSVFDRQALFTIKTESGN